MQKQNDQLRDFTLLPVPTVLLDELEIYALSTIQFRLSRGRLIIEPIDGDETLVCFGNCCHCPGRSICEDACR